MLANNLLALIVTFILSVSWLRLNDWAAHRGWIGGHFSRKLIHIGTGPLFVICWLLFNDAPVARFLAASIPLLITFQFALVGFGLIQDEAAVQAMSRSGDRREILKGPLYYGIIFVLLTIVYWKESPIGIIALMLMCGGDGLADILGRRFDRYKLPWNPRKTWAGSLGMLSGGWIFAAFIMMVYISAGVFAAPFSSYLLPLTLISVTGALVESLPIQDIDNITTTLSAVILGHLLL